jgi:hypothetical protein
MASKCHRAIVISVYISSRCSQIREHLLSSKVGQSKSREEVISGVVSSTHSSVSDKALSSMQNSPVIKDETLTSHQLANVLKLGVGENAVPLPNGLVELGHIFGAVPGIHHRSVVVVPSHLLQLSGDGVVGEHRLGNLGGDTHAVLSGRVGRDSDPRKQLVALRVEFLKLLGGSESVYQHVFATLAIMVQTVEQLQTGRVSPVSTVGVRGQVEVCVSSVVHGEIGGEVPEAAVVSMFDVGQSLAQLLGVFGSGGDSRHEAEPVGVDLLAPFGQALVGLHHVFELDSGLVGFDIGCQPVLLADLRVELGRAGLGLGLGLGVVVAVEPVHGVRGHVAVVLPGHVPVVTVQGNLGGLHVFRNGKGVLQTLLGQRMVVLLASAVVSQPDVVERADRVESGSVLVE